MINTYLYFQYSCVVATLFVHIVDVWVLNHLKKLWYSYGTVQLQLHTRVICHAWYHALFSVKRKFITHESEYSHKTNNRESEYPVKTNIGQ